MNGDLMVANAWLQRLKQLALAIGGIAATAFLAYAFYMSFVIITAVAFTGAGGSAADKFLVHFVPVGYFLQGAIVCGGLMAIVSAICASDGLWLGIILVTAIIGGILAVVIPSIGASLTQVLELVYVFLRDTY